MAIAGSMLPRGADRTQRRIQTRQITMDSTARVLVDYAPGLYVQIVKNAGSVNVLYGDAHTDLVNNGAILAPGDVLNVYEPMELYGVAASSTCVCSVVTVLPT